MEINDMVRSVAQQTGAACLDTWQLFMATGDNWKVLSSGAPSPTVSGASQCLGLHTGRGFTPVFFVPHKSDAAALLASHAKVYFRHSC
jgi:hypothetical protein